MSSGVVCGVCVARRTAAYRDIRRMITATGTVRLTKAGLIVPTARLRRRLLPALAGETPALLGLQVAVVAKRPPKVLAAALRALPLWSAAGAPRTMTTPTGWRRWRRCPCEAIGAAASLQLSTQQLVGAMRESELWS